ncbi:MAG TPA: BamA/TamA family outer membrane protein [Ohtaekwangia sp.]
MGTSKIKYSLLIKWLPALLLSGCVGTKHLKENEKLLYRQSIQAPRHIDKDQLKKLYSQSANRKIFGLPVSPLVSIYYLGENNYDQEKMVKRKEKAVKKFDTKIARTEKPKRIANLQFRKQQKIDKFDNKIENGNTVMQWGEPITVLDSSLVTATEERMRDYLFSKGYFKNTVSSTISLRKGTTRHLVVKYSIEPGPAYTLDSIFYKVNDTIVFKIIQAHKRESFLKHGERYDQNNFTKEVERIDILLKDNGYYDFSRQYIEFAIDSSSQASSQKLDILIVVNDPAKRGYHKKFKIDEVRFTTDASVANRPYERTGRIYRDIHYHYYEDNYNLKILSQRVRIKQGDLYNRSETFNTQRQLANVDAFKFVNVNYDTTGGRFVANIYTSPLPRYEWSNEAGVNVTQGFPGPFYNMTFKKRNIFKGMETFDLSGRFGFEGVAPLTSDQDFYKSIEAGVNASLVFPQFIWPFKERTRFRHAGFNPKTRFTTGYAFTDRPEYRRTAISVNGTYSWQNNKGRSYQLTPVNMSVIDTANLSSDFRDLLYEQERLGNFSLLNSFSPSFVNSVIFSVTWNYKNYGNFETSSSFIRAQIESGGTIWNIFDPKIITDLELQYFKYIRFGLDLRRINVINKNTTVAYRMNSGFAYAYGENKSLPYEKFFFAGGSNSIRAWRPRRLGPGSFKPPTTTSPESTADPVSNGYFDYSIEQPADILLEASLEVRQKLFGFVSGAVFVDAGNVWTFQPRKKFVDDVEVSNGNSQFKINQFYKEIAVGTGFGLRFDFSFLILRFDVGMKVWDPARDLGDRFVLDRVKFFKPFATKTENSYSDFKEPVIYNVGIGYPF